MKWLKIFHFSRVYNIFGLPMFAVLPTAVGSLFCPLLPKHILKVEGQGMFNFYIDFLIRRAKNNFIAYLRESKVSATIIFGILNAFIINGLMKKSTVTFWFTSVAHLKSENIDDVENTNVENTNKCKIIHGDVKCSDYFKHVSKMISMHF